MAQENTQRRKDEELTGRDLPNADGRVSDEDVQAVSNEDDDRPIGQDHSTKGHASQMPESGVGTIQNDNDISSNKARIKE